MPVLKNPKHEKFAQALHQGFSASEAYVKAGFKENRGNATTLKRNKSIQKRLSELALKEQEVERKATDKAAERLSLTKERVLLELMRIGFADLSDALEWGPDLGTIPGDDEGLIRQNGVRLKPSKDLSKNVTAAISEVRQTKEGIAIKFHSKPAALNDLAKHLGLLTERLEIDAKVEVQDMDKVEIARRVAFLIAQGAHLAKLKQGEG